jgi:metal-responsive CopG/Arc/MetJ family transcriptional regulator
MKTAVSLPDDVFEQAEDLARRRKTSRSKLYADALREYLAVHDSDRVTAALNALFETESSALDPFVAAATAEILRRTEW